MWLVTVARVGLGPNCASFVIADSLCTKASSEVCLWRGDKPMMFANNLEIEVAVE